MRRGYSDNRRAIPLMMEMLVIHLHLQQADQHLHDEVIRDNVSPNDAEGVPATNQPAQGQGHCDWWHSVLRC